MTIVATTKGEEEKKETGNSVQPFQISVAHLDPVSSGQGESHPNFRSIKASSCDSYKPASVM